MIVYAETSAVLRWLLGGDGAADIRRRLDAGERVLSSRLTIAEARRALSRAAADGALPAHQATERRRALDTETQRWDVMEMTEAVWLRGEERFPIEPVRMLDALHLATALRWAEALGTVAMLSADARVADNWRALGFPSAL